MVAGNREKVRFYVSLISSSSMGAPDKANKHLSGFKILLDNHREFMTKEVYDILHNDVDVLLGE